MFGDVGWGELALLAVLALFIFGPDKLPKAAAEAGRALRQLRGMAMSARRDIQSGLGPEMKDFDIADLNPRRFVRRHLFEDNNDDFDAPRRDTRRTAATAGDGGLDYGERPPYDTEAT
ncbi:MAG: translocase [Streptosporangiales bacterium]|nr:translocase [Streptosporangiales bacterium]